MFDYAKARASKVDQRQIHRKRNMNYAKIHTLIESLITGFKLSPMDISMA